MLTGILPLIFSMLGKNLQAFFGCFSINQPKRLTKMVIDRQRPLATRFILDCCNDTPFCIQQIDCSKMRDAGKFFKIFSKRHEDLPFFGQPISHPRPKQQTQGRKRDPNQHGRYFHFRAKQIHRGNSQTKCKANPGRLDHLVRGASTAYPTHFRGISPGIKTACRTIH